jgi:hypothetical protein
MDIIPIAKKEFIKIINLIKKDINFYRLLGLIRYTFYLSPIIILFYFTLLKRRQILKQKETFKNLGLNKILKKNEFQPKYILSKTLENKIEGKILKFQRMKMSYCNPSGIYNYGNNCYINSLIQVIN